MPHLERYHGKSSRHECPNCHDKYSFTWYVDDEGQPINPACGKCNHENNCGYHYTPRQYYNDHPDHRPTQDTPIKPISKPKPKQLCSIPFQYVNKSASYNSVFVKFLFDLFNADTVCYLMALYAIGATKNGDVIFWQIDKNGIVRSGKIMKYGTDGHRIKDEHGVKWVHPLLKKQGSLPQDWELTQCLFGEHLLKWSWNKDKTIALVESEKTALIGAAIYPEYVWIATGGKHNLQIEKTKTLTGRKVIMFPDTDTTGATFRLWKDRAKEMANFCKVTVSDLMEQKATPEQKTKSIDIADWLIDSIKTGEKPIELTNEMAAVVMAERSPHVNRLITELNLRPD